AANQTTLPLPPSAIPAAPVAQIHETAPLPPVAQNMPNGSMIPQAPAKLPEPEPPIHEVAALPPVAANMPQGSVFPPVPAIQEPAILPVQPLHASTEILPQGSVFPEAPALNQSIMPLTKTQVVVTSPETQVMMNQPTPAPAGATLVAHANDPMIPQPQ